MSLVIPFLFASGQTAAIATTSAPMVMNQVEEKSEEVVSVVKDTSGHIAEVVKMIKDKFGDKAVQMIKVGFCESGLQQFSNKTGKAITGIQNKRDKGALQINADYHIDDAIKLGMDIYTLEGNVDFAKVLYDQYGLKPWVHSKPCWSSPKLPAKLVALGILTEEEIQ